MRKLKISELSILWVIRSRKSKKYREYNSHKKDKWNNNDLQNTTQKTKCNNNPPIKTGTIDNSIDEKIKDQ
jgi:hypothetical protein